MIIKELVSVKSFKDVDEARRNNWGREQSTAAGQQLGKNYAAGLPTADKNKAVQDLKAQAATSQTNPNLQSRLAAFKQGKKVAAPAAQPQAQAPAQTDQPPADAAQEPSKWDKFKQGAKQAASSTAQAVKKYGPGLAKGAANLATGTVKAAGDIAAQTAGGIAQTVGAIPGGFKKGYDVARAGQKFKFAPDEPPAAAGGGAQSSAAAPAAADTANVDSELASLKTMINRLDKRLDNVERTSGGGAQQARPNLRVAQ